MGKRHKKYLSKDDIQMANKPMKICSTTLTIRGGRLKPQWDNMIRIAKIIKSGIMKCWWGFKEAGSFCTAGENIKQFFQSKKYSLIRHTTVMCCVVLSRSVVSDFVTPCTLALQAPLSMQSLQGRILEWVAMPFPTHGSNPSLPHCRQIFYHWAT